MADTYRMDDLSENDENTDMEDDYNDYYANSDDVEMESTICQDPEYYPVDLLKLEDIERLLNENVEALRSTIQVCGLFNSYYIIALPNTITM